MNSLVEEKVSVERATMIALSLSPHEQAVLMTRLHENLEHLDLDGMEPEWHLEIERRVREVENGTAELVDHEVAMRMIRERLRTK